MTIPTLGTSTSPQRLESFPSIPDNGSRVYAITFDMDIDSLKLNYGDPDNDADVEIRKVVQKQGFNGQEGSVCFGGQSLNAVSCVLDAFEPSRVLPWFAASVREIRLLRIEEFNDPMSAVPQATQDN